jgi:hypothetical protein
LFSGQAAIDYLAREAIKDDPSASSHWRQQHAEFKFNGGNFFGLKGFGGARKKPYGLRLWISEILQLRFRRFGRHYIKFRELDKLAKKVTSKQGREYDLDVLRQALTLAFLHETVPECFKPNVMCCVIRDGFASMTSLLLTSKSASRFSY